MPENIADRDLKTVGIVLRRTNYGEADRILNIITPNGKISVIAKGVRRAKSKLAGGVEMFTLSEMQIHQGRSGLGVITGTKMLYYCGNILKDYGRIELMALVLKRISVAAERLDSEDFFEITKQVMIALDKNMDAIIVESWFWLNLMRASGEEVNLYRDGGGAKLMPNKQYEWNVGDMAFWENEQGKYGANEIKMLRLMVSMKLEDVNRVKVTGELQERVLDLARVVARK